MRRLYVIPKEDVRYAHVVALEQFGFTLVFKPLCVEIWKEARACKGGW